MMGQINQLSESDRLNRLESKVYGQRPYVLPTWMIVCSICGAVAYAALLYFIFRGQLHV